MDALLTLYACYGNMMDNVITLSYVNPLFTSALHSIVIYLFGVF